MGSVGSVSCIKPTMLQQHGKQSYHIIYSGALAVFCGDHYSNIRWYFRDGLVHLLK